MRHDGRVEHGPETEPRRGWGLAIAVAIVGLVVGGLAFEPALADLPVPSFVERFGAVGLCAALGFGLTGAALVAAQPEHRMGWLMVAIGGTQALSLFLQGYGLVAIHDTDAGLLGGGWAIAIGSGLWAPAHLAVPTLFLLLFPDGRTPTRRWRIVAAGAISAMTLAGVGFFLMPPEMNDVEIYPAGYQSPSPTWQHADWLTSAAAVIAVPTAVASIASLVVRYRSAGRGERPQLAWVLLGGLLTISLLVLAFLTGDAGPWIAGFAMLPLPITVAIGIGQHGLWDADGVLRRTLVGGALSGTLLAVYVAIVAIAGTLFERATAGASLVAAAVVAVLMLPAHRRATRWANELVYARAGRAECGRAAVGWRARLCFAARGRPDVRLLDPRRGDGCRVRRDRRRWRTHRKCRTSRRRSLACAVVARSGGDR